MDFPQEYFTFVKEHLADDPASLRLRFHGDSREWIAPAIGNIAALKKGGKFKIGDKDFTPRVIPVELSAQQATSARVANLHATLAAEIFWKDPLPLHILDMTLGLGMDARMLLAKFSDATLKAFDLNPLLVDAARVNFVEEAASVNFTEESPRVDIECADSVEYLRNLPESERFDLIFIDPARRGDSGQRLFNLHDCQPDLIDLLPLLRRHTSFVMAKLSPMLDVTQTLRDLPCTRELHIVEESGECKEILALIDFTPSTPLSDIKIIIDRFSGNRYQDFAFTQAEEAAAAEDMRSASHYLGRLPRRGEILLEPSAAAMKAAPFALLASRFGIAPLHPNTHLYVATDTTTALSDFPGTQYMVEAAWPFSSSVLKRLPALASEAYFPENPGRQVKVDIAVRNLKGFTPEILRRKTRLKPGDDMRLYGATLATPSGDKPALILTRRLEAKPN